MVTVQNLRTMSWQVLSALYSKDITIVPDFND